VVRRSRQEHNKIGAYLAQPREKTMKAIFTAALAGFALAGVGTAEAASLASGKKLEVKVDPKNVSAEAKALWDRFGGWCAIAEWHPAVKSCTEAKEGDDTYRTLTLGDGGKIKEKLVSKGDLTYRYAIVESPLPVKNYEAQFSVTPDDDDEDEVNVVWAATYDPADGKTDKDARGAIDGIFKDGIASIKGKIGDKAGGKKDKD
jgi:hypothetical protein